MIPQTSAYENELLPNFADFQSQPSTRLPVKHAPLTLADTKLTSSKLAPENTAFSKVAHSKEALARFAFVKLAPGIFDSEKSEPVSSASANVPC